MSLNYGARIPRQGLKVWVDAENKNNTSGGNISPADSLLESSATINTGNLPRYMAMTPNGSYLFFIGLSGTGTFYRYSMSTPYDISTATSSQSISANNEDWVYFANDQFLILANSSYLKLYVWGTAYDINSIALGSPTYTMSVRPYYGGGFSIDGLTLIVNNTSNNIRYEYTLTSPYDIRTATLSTSTSVSTSTFSYQTTISSYVTGQSAYGQQYYPLIKLPDGRYLTSWYNTTTDFSYFAIMPSIDSTIPDEWSVVSNDTTTNNIYTMNVVFCDDGKLRFIGTNINTYEHKVYSIPVLPAAQNIITKKKIPANSDRVSFVTDADGKTHMDFDGAGTRVAYLIVDPTTHGLDTRSSYSFNWWHYFVDAGNQDHPNIGWETGSSWDGVDGVVLGTGWGTDGPRWGFDGVGYNYTSMSSSARYQTNTWQNYCVIYNGTANTLKTYLNGVLVDSRTGINGDTIGNSNPMYIGATNNRAGNWNGYMDVVQIWDRELSELEVFKLFEAYRGRFGK